MARFGTTSFIYRAGWADNVERLAPRVDDIEILVFSSGPESLPGPGELQRLHDLKRIHDLSYTVHTPLTVSLGSAERSVRERGIEEIARTIRTCLPLEPLAYVLHVYLGDRENDPHPPGDLDAWRRRVAESLNALLNVTGVESKRLCVESLDYDLTLLDPVLASLGLGVALDIGHLARDGVEVAPALEYWGERIQILQWHGTDPKTRDHKSLDHYPTSEALNVLSWIDRSDFDGVVTVEVFSEQDFERSWRLLTRWRQGDLMDEPITIASEPWD
ncbi:MAG: cobamide remodeling phosphodiesterase CbiR [Myxococcota bacterium]